MSEVRARRGDDDRRSEEAATLARRCRGPVRRRAQAMPIALTYRWEGVVETADERLLLIKTRADRVDEVKPSRRAPLLRRARVRRGARDRGLPAHLAWIDGSVGRTST